MAHNNRQAVVIGGGLGGLAACLRLASRGWRVVLCEQNKQLGGKMNRHAMGELHFDTGPSLITMPWAFEELFHELQLNMDDHVELVPVRPLGAYTFADGSHFRYSSSLPDCIRELNTFSPNTGQEFMQYMRLGARLYQLSVATFLRRPITAPPDKETLAAVLRLPLRNAWGKYHRTVEKHFHDERLQQVFNRYPTFVGSSPYLSPATLSLIPYLEFALGGYHIRGGLYTLIEKLTSLAVSMGVTVLTSCRIVKISHSRGRCNGVVTEHGDHFPASVVVMNGDSSTTGSLLEKGATPLPMRQRSMSGFILLLAVKRDSLPLVHHNVFFSEDYRKEFRELCEQFVFPEDPTVYLSAPARTDSSLASDTYEPLFVMANAPPREDLWTNEYVQMCRERVFARLRKSGLEKIDSVIMHEHVITPATIAARDGAPGGAIYGQNAHGWRQAFFRPQNKDPRIRGLYYVGGTVHPGGGTPIVLLSARIAVNLIERNEHI